VDSVEYGEIPLVLDRWGATLLQVKDQKAGNVRKCKPSKTTSKVHAPPASIDNEVEDLHAREVRHLPPFSNDNPTSVRKAHTAEHDLRTPRVISQPVFAPDHIVNHASLGFATSQPNIPPNKHVQFTLLPAAEITPSIPKLPNNKHVAEIERLKEQLALLERNRESEDNGFSGYECLDVSMNDHNAADGMPEIILRKSKPEGPFGIKKWAVPIQKSKAGVSRVSPLSFYQGNVVPPSARGVKGKQRAAYYNAAPSSPLHARHDSYVQQRYLTDRTAGPSRETFL
jgi:hypothetical protein